MPINQPSLTTLRVDQVGSLLRLQALTEAYAQHGNGEIRDAELTRIQDESVKELIAKQEAHGFSISPTANIVGNLISEDDQWRKLELIQQIAAEVWGN